MICILLALLELLQLQAHHSWGVRKGLMGWGAFVFVCMLGDRHIPCRAWFRGLLPTLLMQVRRGKLEGVEAKQ